MLKRWLHFNADSGVGHSANSNVTKEKISKMTMMMMPHTICVFYLYLKKWQLWSYEVRRSLFPSPSLFSFSLTIPILSKNFPPFPSLVFFPHPLSSFSLFSANQTFSLSAIFFQSGWSTIREAAKCLKTFANRLPPPLNDTYFYSPFWKIHWKGLKETFVCLLVCVSSYNS